MLFPSALQPTQVTILAYGALLSETSSRLTFPHLTQFRHVRVRGYRRVFGHPHLFLLREGLLENASQQPWYGASLSAEPDAAASFVAAAFDVVLDDAQRADFVRREPEYHIASVPFYALDDDQQALGHGVICLASDDDDLPADLVGSLPPTERGRVWHWPRDSNVLLPAHVYLRHCLLAVQKEKQGAAAYTSFLHDTFLADRSTTLADYLQTHETTVMASRPPERLATRFGG